MGSFERRDAHAVFEFSFRLGDDGLASLQAALDGGLAIQVAILAIQGNSGAIQGQTTN